MNNPVIKLTVLSVAIMLTATSMLSGCAKKEESSAAPSGKVQVSKNISILTSHANAKYAMQAKEDDSYIKEMSKESGYDLKFEFLGHANDFIQQLTVRFASGDLPDLIRTDSISSTVHPNAVEQGVFTDLTPLIDKFGPNLKKKIPKEAWASPRVSKDGKIYAIPALTALPANTAVYIRQDWLDKLGMKQPKTLEDYLAFFEAVKKEDMNGNGDPNDEYGLYARENLVYSNLFFNEFGAMPDLWQMRDGNLVPGMVLPETKDAIKFWKMLYEKGYVNPNFFTTKAGDWEAAIKQGKGAVWLHGITNYTSNWATEAFINQKNVKINMIEPPSGPKGKGLSPVMDQILHVWVVPSKAKNAEEVVKFLNWAWSDEAEKFLSLGIKGSNYTEENGKINWDPKSPANKDNDASIFYQLSINPRGDGRMQPEVVNASPSADVLKAAMKTTSENLIKNDGLHMPALQSIKTHPELVPGTGAGTLFLDMFAKVLTGKEELDPAFDKFVQEWRRRGGDAAIKEATDWYNNFHKN
jgi:putative aldouronate transport system substrate-binding protein